MKVLHLSEQRQLRGGERQILLLAKGLLRADIPIGICARPRSPLSGRAASARIPLVELPLRGELDIISAVKLTRFARRYDYDILHAHTSHTHSIAALAKELSRRRLKLVVSRTVSRPVPRNPLALVKYRRAADHYIAFSRSVRQKLLDAGVEESKITVIPPRIDVERLHAMPPADIHEQLQIPPGARIVGTVGYVTAQKAHEVLLEAFAELASRFPHLYLVIIGGGDLEGMRQLAARLQVSDRLRLPGDLENAPAVAGRFDVYASSSIFEGMPIAVMEAMYFERPIVATACEGMEEEIEHGKSGILVPMRDASALAREVARVLSDPHLARSLGAEARKRAERCFTPQEMIEKTIEVYRRVLAS